MTTDRPSADRIRDLVMIAILAVWTIYAGAAVVQLFTTGAKVLESLPPFWFWGIPLGPYGAMYAPWRPGSPVPLPPDPPVQPPAPGAAT